MNHNSCYSCNSCNSCNFCYSCNFCNFCNFCYSCNSCYSCYSCNSCNFCSFCKSCNFCYYSSGLKMSENMLWCLGDGMLSLEGIGYQKNHHLFNKPVTKERIQEVLKISNKLGFKYDFKLGWTESWKLVKDWSKLQSLPEYDEEIVKKITGLDFIPTSSTKILEGKTYLVQEGENGVLTLIPTQS